ncbi:hypothetical protein AVEN_267735-1 [Araneus ventricosus]|uniref:Uncharacterized protein n=1 Tax=Araneus ventricosus TaxID=182803 RepID=A0A4Y2CX19_ARAVE|nr:hypothetical protein AVEN_267735-1 [Araneus ventricosus]
MPVSYLETFQLMEFPDSLLGNQSGLKPSNDLPFVTKIRTSVPRSEPHKQNKTGKKTSLQRKPPLRNHSPFSVEGAHPSPYLLPLGKRASSERMDIRTRMFR